MVYDSTSVVWGRRPGVGTTISQGGGDEKETRGVTCERQRTYLDHTRLKYTFVLVYIKRGVKKYAREIQNYLARPSDNRENISFKRMTTCRDQGALTIYQTRIRGGTASFANPTIGRRQYSIHRFTPWFILTSRHVGS